MDSQISLNELGELEGHTAELLARSSSRDHRPGRVEVSNSLETGVWTGLLEMGLDRLIRRTDIDGLGLPYAALIGVFRSLGSHLLKGPAFEAALLTPMICNDFEVYESPQRVPEFVGDGLIVDGTVIFESESTPVAHLDTTAEQISGELPAVRYADVGDFLFLAIESGDRRRACVLPLAADGVEVSPAESVIDPCGDWFRVTLQDVPAASCIWAAETSTRLLLRRVLAWARIIASSELAGITKTLVEMSRSYALERHQFGRPIGSFQAIQHSLAEMHARKESLLKACDALAEIFVSSDRPDPEFLGRIVKAHADEVAESVRESALQVHGGIGFTAEHDLHLYFLRAYVLESLYGDRFSLLDAIGEDAVGDSRGNAATNASGSGQRPWV